MKLYEINEQIQALMDSITVDEETGELHGDAEAVMEQLDGLEMERASILGYLAKEVLNLRADETAMKAEEDRLKKNRERVKKREDAILSILDRECGGVKTDLGVAVGGYRKSEAVVIDDPAAAMEWLNSNNRDDCLRFIEPEISKADVKRLIQSGTEVPGIRVEQRNTFSLR